MKDNVCGVQLYTVRASTQTIEGVRETLRRVVDIGYKTVQISGFGPVDPRDVARAVEDNGLIVAGTHVGWESLIGDTDAEIEKHKLWGCRHAAIGGLDRAYQGEEGLKRFLDELPPVAEKLAAEGIDFSYHNHSHEFVRYGKKTWLEQLYDKADPKHLKAEIDTYWVQHGGGDPAAWIGKCTGRIPLLHLKDMIIVRDEGQRFAEIGEGNLNWPAIFHAAEQAGVEYYLVEQDDCYGRDPFESLEISYRYLRSMGLS